MVQNTKSTVVAPMLTSIEAYSNFWIGMPKCRFAKDYLQEWWVLNMNKKIECLKIPKHNSLCSFKYTEISENLKKGCFPVAMVYSSIFINTNSADSKKISFFNDNEDFDSFAFNDVEGEFLIETFYNYNYLLATELISIWF